VVQSALKNIPGVSDLKIPGQNSPNPSVKFKDQIIQYRGDAQPDQVIAILHKNTNFQVRVAKRPDGQLDNVLPGGDRN